SPPRAPRCATGRPTGSSRSVRPEDLWRSTMSHGKDSADPADGADAADRVARAMEAVPRARFLPASRRHLARQGGRPPIGDGQTNSQPTTVADMVRLLDVREGNRVLDLGAGSGWTTALLAHLVGPDGEVLGVERQRSLLAPARAALAESVPVARAEIRE